MIEDRWLKKRPNPETGERERTALWGTGKRYRVRIPGVKDRSFHKAGEAKAWEAKAVADTNRGEFFDPRSGQILLRDYINDTWLPTHKARGTTRYYLQLRVKTHIVPHLGRHPIITIGSEHLRTWSSQLGERLGWSTAQGVWDTLSACLGSAVDDGRISRNPCKQFKHYRPKKVGERRAGAWTLPEAMAVINALPERYRALAGVALAGGLRQGEAFGLGPDDVVDGFLEVRRQVVLLRGRLYFAPPKGAKARRTPVPPAVEKRLAAHAEAFPPQEVTLAYLDPDEPDMPYEARKKVSVRLYFTGPRGGALRRNDFNADIWKPALAAAGFVEEVPRGDGPIVTGRRPGGKRARAKRALYEESPGLGFHRLRHTFASVTLDAGESVVTLSHWLGHSSPKITLDYYAHFMPGAGTRGVAAMDSWFTAES